MNFNFLRVERDGVVANIQLQRPECGNALSLKLMREIIQACESFKYDTGTRVVIFRGAGRNFCVGADLRDPDRVSADEVDLLERSRATQLGTDLIAAILGINQITIAAVQGAAAGGGACIASACDFRIGTGDCRIGYPGVKLGMNLSWGALPLCYDLIGPARAKRMVIGGELEAAEDLLAWGFVDELVAADDLDGAVQEMAQFYADRPALAAQMIKRGLNAIQSAASAGVMHMDGHQFALASQSDEYEKQRVAFLNRNR